MWTIHKLHATSTKRKQSEVGEEDPSSAQSLETHADGLGPDQRSESSLGPPWSFSDEDLERFPALTKRNFWCIQRHQARALHYDLRMQLDGATVSWAIPRGLLGISKDGEANRLAVETTLHPISYTVHEGSDGRLLPSGERCGTLLWDIGTYSITYPWTDYDSDSDYEQRRKRRKARTSKTGSAILQEDDSDDPTGKFEEDKFRQALTRRIRAGKSRSIHFVLKGGYKMTNHHFILVLSPGPGWAPTYSRSGQIKKTWFIRLPRGVQGYPWGKGGEEGDEHGRSVKTGRTLTEVCHGQHVTNRIWNSEAQRFASWREDGDEIKEEGKT